MKKICVIGGGASGLVAAYFASLNNCEVTLLEKNKSVGKKLLVTGNGRCNYFNEDFDIKHYHSENLDILKDIITKENKEKILSFFENIGVVPQIKDNLYYPYTNQSSTIKSSLENALKNVKIINECQVLDIENINNQFKIKTNIKDFLADKVIISTGSLSYITDEFNKVGYDIAKKYNHKIIDIKPALVALIGNKNYYKKWAGIRCNAILSLYEDKKLLKREIGEIQLTDYGISGICVFQLSSIISHNIKNKKIIINFIPIFKDKSVDEIIEIFNKRNQLLNCKNIYDLLLGYVNNKLLDLLLNQCEIKNNYKWDNLSEDKKIHLIKYLTSYEFFIKNTQDFRKAQVCLGGISLNDINIKTMESKKIPNMYFTGEMLDVDGECGGFNLGFAWLSGMIAGSYAGENNDKN